MTAAVVRETPAVAVEWTAACPYRCLEPERGVVALVGGVPVAVFRVHDGRVYALDNIDPFCGASVLARGIVGTRGDAPTVASPMHKHVFDLRTGRCLDDPEVVLRTYPVRLRDGLVEVGGLLQVGGLVEVSGQG
ncbi:nitrite reductase small subunit NirD [Rugosimonospora africana]|uniref:Rieske domain-containing protein n=1 Tax=Rugosimonospora africana TaxID=556532 RepID=A0A8J3VPI0_9ACTN|nr:nitrite reductase small subunit NirD [Rugosimonospora africana]GIH14110.1 hypothetical protein Raf01_22820 [Rugosimonospora africana]